MLQFWLKIGSEIGKNQQRVLVRSIPRSTIKKYLTELREWDSLVNTGLGGIFLGLGGVGISWALLHNDAEHIGSAFMMGGSVVIVASVALTWGAYKSGAKFKMFFDMYRPMALSPRAVHQWRHFFIANELECGTSQRALWNLRHHHALVTYTHTMAHPPKKLTTRASRTSGGEDCDWSEIVHENINLLHIIDVDDSILNNSLPCLLDEDAMADPQLWASQEEL